MLHVHHHGIGECGFYYEVAGEGHSGDALARKHQHPLQCVMEKVSRGERQMNWKV
jgi:ATP-dependent Clp protease adaptor protein ClpS